jgi:PAS domain S-box-containing protein
VDLNLTGKANRSLRHDQVFGYDALLPEWTYLTMLAHVLPEDRANVAARFEAALQSGNVWDFECRIQPRDQAIRWIWGRGKIRRDESGQAVSMLGIVGDITDRKLAEQRLRAQVERLTSRSDTRAWGAQDLASVFSGGPQPGR